ncbi:MAG: DUF1552 domain-containing protein [Akkermansiaceae bacterium]
MNSRRHFLKSTSLGSGALLFAPILNGIRAHAAGLETALPKRYVFIVKASGIDPYNLVSGGLPGQEIKAKPSEAAKVSYPSSREKLLSASLNEHALPEVLQPLEGLKNKVNIIQGLSGNNLKGNHTSGYGTLSCHNSELTAIAPTVDALLGLKHSTGPYPLFGMATNGSLRGQASVPDDSYVFPNLSALKSGQGVAFQASPTKAFNELFGSAVMAPDELKKSISLNRNLMDFLKDDAQRISKQLTQEDRERFDGYVESFDSLRVREERKSALKDSIEKNAPEYADDKYTSMQHMDRMEAQFELGTAALIAGLTNVITLRPDTLGTLYGDLGFNSFGLHAIGHGAVLPSGVTSHQMRKTVDTYHMGLLAKMAAAFEGIPEGNGTMLDNTTIVYLSCAGGKHHGGNTDWPVITIGGGGGSFKTGQYLQLPSYQKDGHKTLGNFYNSLLSAGGIEIGDHFGQVDPGLKDIDIKGPINELIA